MYKPVFLFKKTKKIKCRDFFTGEEFVVKEPKWIDFDVFSINDGKRYRVIKEEETEFIVIELKERVEVLNADFGGGLKV